MAPWSRGARLLGEQPGALQAQEQKPPGWLQAELRNAQHPSGYGLLREPVTAEATGRRAWAGPGPRVQGGEVPWELSQEPTATAKSRAAISRGPHLSPLGLTWQDAHLLCPGVTHPPRGPWEPGGESGLCISCYLLLQGLHPGSLNLTTENQQTPPLEFVPWLFLGLFWIASFPRGHHAHPIPMLPQVTSYLQIY